MGKVFEGGRRGVVLDRFVETPFLETYYRDPIHAAFSFSRYKQVARLLTGFNRVVEVGCGNGFYGAIVRQFVKELIQTDLAEWNPINRPFSGDLDAVFALDVLEHIYPADEDSFLQGIAKSLVPHGTVIIGTPSLESQPYASKYSKQEHVNCKTQEELKTLMQRHFECVYIFGMNDESLTTGFGPMCHYRIALANTPRRI